MATTKEVTGRNGILYDATHVSGNVYIVGKYLVIVLDNVVRETICKATKTNVAAIRHRETIVS